MPKFSKVDYKDGRKGYAFLCPGCDGSHIVTTEGHGPRWDVSGVEEDRPTVTPSIRARSGNAQGPTCCHSYVRDGKIQFLNDCTHDSAGKTVEIPDFYE